MTLIITAKQNTVLKQATGQSTDLKAEQLHPIQQGQQLTVLAHRGVDSDHLYVTLNQTFNGKNSHYIYGPHWEGFKTGKLKATFKPLNMLDEYGGEIFNLEMEMDGDKINMEFGSGQPGHSPIPVEQDWPGSNNPIPQGIYTIEKPVYEDPATCDPRIGPIWLALTPQTFTNARGGFLIHLDYNWRNAPGTAGCPFPLRNRDIHTVADWVERSSEAVLHVEYGF